MRDDHPTRRAVLAGAKLTLGLAIAAEAASPAQAQPNFKQADVMYQAMPKGDQRCGLCANFAPPNSCALVQGTISPNAWCQLFSAKG